LDLTPAVLKG